MDHRASIRKACTVPLAIAAACAVSPALAQEAADRASDGAGTPVEAEATQPAGEARSAFGRVMALLVSALERNAESPGATPATEDSAVPDAAQAGSVQQITVSHRFRLDAPPAAIAPTAPRKEPLATNSADE